MMSGGVIIAAIINISTMAYFLYSLKNLGDTKSITERKYMMIGNSKTRPQANEEVLTKLM